MVTGAEQGRIVEKGLEIFRLMEAEPPVVFDKRRWAGELMDLAMRDPSLKVQLFRFIDVFPTLTTPELVAQHLKEYFLTSEAHLPDFVHKLLAGASSGLAASLTALLLKKNIVSFSRTFIAGESPADAIKPLKRIWDGGKTFTVDILGETALSEKEAAHYHDIYLALVELLARETAGWRTQAPERERSFPRVNVSVKLSSLYSRIGPLNYEDSVTQAKERLRLIFRRARETGAFVNLDMEMYSLKNITLDVFTELLDEAEFKGWEGAGIALQAYLKDTGEDLLRLVGWARGGGRRITVRLVKGAYWEYETVNAAQKGWRSPVFEHKAHTDWNFERCAELMLASNDCITSAFGTHNVRSIAFVLEAAKRLGVTAERLEFQMLYGMAEPIKGALHRMGQVVREYAPVGELLPGMAYLVRRLLENTSNEGFLRRTFVENVQREALLAAPEPWPGEPPPQSPSGIGPFTNEPPLDFSVIADRIACRAAITKVREKLGRDYPAIIDGKEYLTDDLVVSVNPARPEEAVGRFAGVSPELVDRAVASARKAQKAWGRKSPEERAEVLFRAAALARERRHKLLAWQVVETGKNWAEADADVAEAIDYLEYYGREALRLGTPLKLGDVPGEENRYHYLPRGVGVVIAPWNFPLAISMGMVSAALVAGNAVLYKPSSLSVVNGWQVFTILREAGVPDGVLNFIPGRGEAVGNYLVRHREVNIIAFTGSREVGLKIMEQAARTGPGQMGVKRVITEMGGKNAIIVDADADLDQAVAGVIQSAFGYQGQKCSACSRVIVLAGCYDRFMERFVEAVRGIAVGPPEDPACFMGPLIDDKAKVKVSGYVELGRKEGKVMGEAPVPESGYYVPPVVVADLPRDSRLLREEIFGPLLAVIKVRDMDEALERANETDYALTGGLYSRSPATIGRVREEFGVGNLYINRPITGAIVGRQPFGGFRMSGVGSKAGGPDYLLQFLEPRVVTENTMRRGFTPEVIA
ncbi:MAG: proline dehydrogenase / delta 1-pyrroline-5-carboxylate [Geobacteraceae bacterium]|nr:MAG: proline dehydrogenase / delta 1-pyrroline-5-carboxylate [Geobacteraceae bacterium]